VPRRLAAATPAFRAPAGLRLAVNGLLIVWSTAVVVVLLDDRRLATFGGLAVTSALLGVGLVPVVRRMAASDGEYLVVNNGFRSRWLPWREVESLRLDASFWTGAVVAVLRSGEAVRLSATTVTFLGGRKRWRELEQSRELLAEWSETARGEA
jgi:hypothetical protein